MAESQASAATHGAHVEEHEPEYELGFVRKYIFSTDHKIIGIQFLFTTLFFFLIGGLLVLAVRWQLAWPWSNMPIFGPLVFGSEGGQISPEFYTMAFTMHASIMIFMVVIPILAGAFGNFIIPLQIGARDMAFPKLNMFSYWFMWPAMCCFVASFFVEGGAAASGWTSYPPLSSVWSAAPGSGMGQTLWLTGVSFVGVSSLMGSLNYITTIVTMRCPGMTLFRMPLTTWSLFITAILQAFALPVLTAALVMQIMDRLAGTGFFIPPELVVNNVEASGTGTGGQPILWQHLFWFYSHPAVYIMILPAMGINSDVMATFARKPIFGYKPMVYAISGIAGLGFIVWGHHMFQSGMNPYLGTAFMISTMFIALPSAVKVFNWLGTLWGGNIRFTAAMLNAVAFVSTFIIGGLSGIFMAATPVDIHIHDTYFIVAHIHYVLFGGSVFAIFAGIYYWYPKMFGRHMNEPLGKLHFFLTFTFANLAFFPMHLLGVAGFPRRLADPYHYITFKHLLGLNQFITVCAICLGLTQLIFMFNIIISLIGGKRAGKNPWDSNSLEWQADSPAPHGNWGPSLPVVHRGPYEYSSPEVQEDWLPQTRDLNAEKASS